MPAPQLYKFLDVEEHIDSWLSGGQVPISPAAAFLAEQYAGIKTPDEILQIRGDGMPARIFDQSYSGPQLISIHPNSAIHGESLSMTIRNCIDVDGTILNGNPSYILEDSMVLCLSYSNSRTVAKRLGGKKAIVRIANLANLKNALDEQMGLKSVSARVCYTASADRNHFLKGMEEAMIEEHRLMWRKSADQPLWLTVPKGVARRTEMRA